MKNFKVKEFTKDTVLKYPVCVSLKLDGVRVHVKDGVATSRNGKLLYNIPEMPDGIYEAFFKNWNNTVSIVRNKKEYKPLNKADLYKIYPTHEANTFVKKVSEKEGISEIMRVYRYALHIGFEGLVICDADKRFYKIKPILTFDVPVIGLFEGTNQYKGMLGAFDTPHGKVGTGFTKQQREEFFDESYIGQTIEVAAMGLTENNKFRHPRFERLRFDK